MNLKKLFHSIQTASTITDSVLVGFSGGKDSAVTLDLCFRYFKHVQPYFMYIVQGLEFQEVTLREYEKLYHTKILRVPHFMLGEFMKYGSFRLPDPNMHVIKTVQLYNYLRECSGIHWIACGERIADSIVRRAMIKNSGSIDMKRGRFYPLANWNKKDVMDYVERKNLPLSLENKVLGFSFRSLQGKDMCLIREHFPEDFQKIKKAFPLIEASILHFEEYEQ